MNILTVKRKDFVGFLNDTMSLLWLSKKFFNPNEDTEYGMLPMQCILTLSVSIEAAANCCIESLNHHGQTSNELERLSVLGKYDVFLLSRGLGKTLDRGAKEVQSIAELKQLRDNLVHPKSNISIFEKQKHSNCYVGSCSTYKHLGIIRENGWGIEDAEEVLQKVIIFLKYYFVDQCALNLKQIKSILYSEELIKGKISYDETLRQQSKELAQELKLDLSFLGLAE